MKKFFVFIPAFLLLLLLFVTAGCRVQLVQLVPHSPYERAWTTASRYGYGQVFTVPIRGNRVPVVVVHGVGETYETARRRAYRQGVRCLGGHARIVSTRRVRTTSRYVRVRYLMAVPTST